MIYQGAFSNPTPIMSQSLAAFDRTKSYTLTFSYDLYTIYRSSSCTLSVSLGDVTIYTTMLTPADNSRTNNPRSNNWKTVTSTAITPASREAALSFKYECLPSGFQTEASSSLFLDDLSLTPN